MPTYSYACTECGHAFDQFQSFSDDTLTECPQCQGRLRKLFNAVGVVFKGSGFYRNDSRLPAKEPAGSSQGASGASDSGDSGSSSGDAGSSSGSKDTKSTARPKESSSTGSTTSTASAS